MPTHILFNTVIYSKPTRPTAQQWPALARKIGWLIPAIARAYGLKYSVFRPWVSQTQELILQSNHTAAVPRSRWRSPVTAQQPRYLSRLNSPPISVVSTQNFEPFESFWERDSTKIQLRNRLKRMILV